MEAHELKEWMSANGYSVRTLTLALGMNPQSWRTVQRWRDGTNRVPPYLQLALQALGPRKQAPDVTREPFEG